MDAFGRLMVGVLRTYHYGTITPSYTLVLSIALRQLFSSTDFVNYAASTTNSSVAHAVESLFENITMSFLSSPEFTVDF
jgi:hypothetical protein